MEVISWAFLRFADDGLIRGSIRVIIQPLSAGYMNLFRLYFGPKAGLRWTFWVGPGDCLV
jgi:hypothetical protein